MAKVMLREIAHSRAGDKSNTSNVSVIPYEEKYYEPLEKILTVEVVRDYFKDICFGEVKRYELPKLAALNFVFEQALDGGNTRSMRVDGFGKSLSMYMLSMMVDIPDDI